jgi:hypothetical protein
MDGFGSVESQPKAWVLQMSESWASSLASLITHGSWVEQFPISRQGVIGDPTGENPLLWKTSNELN